MRKIVKTGLLVFAICICCAIKGQTPENDCTKDLKDKLGIMKPWEKGAWETGKYRNVLRDAASIMGTQTKSWKFVDAVCNAKLEPYSDGYFDPYYDGLLYLFSLMHLSGNYRIILPGMK
jgi:hypothetical protein